VGTGGRFKGSGGAGASLDVNEKEPFVGGGMAADGVKEGRGTRGKRGRQR